MPRQLLIIEQPPLPIEASVGQLLAAEGGFYCQRTHWDRFRPDSLRECTAHLVVAVAVPDPAQALSLFKWLRAHPIATPTFAVLPSEPDEHLWQTASEAVDDFIVWPIRPEEWRHRSARLLGPEEQNRELIRCRLSQELGLAQLVGNNAEFLRTIEKIPLLARRDAPVLITGETGTGKELCARAIHHLSGRRNAPFIPVECGALPDHLFENELFGHVRGAFTDAQGDQRGLIAMAEGGTVFLDEIDVLSLTAQVKVLRFLQDHIYKPLGADRLARADVNIIAATNRDLEACVREKQFRPDLYFRLNVLRLHLPPLRDRRGDIEVLARYSLNSLCAAAAGGPKSFSPAALHKLEHYDWPGNIRELFNVVEQAFVFSTGRQVLPSHVPLSTPADASEVLATSFKNARNQAVERFERQYVEEVLRKHHGNITRAARNAGKDRRAFGRLVKKYHIDRLAF